MLEKLMKVCENSYSPYSHFRVGSICVMNDGREFCGVNVENASYGASICSERSAIVSAVSAGYRPGDFKELHILCADSNKVSTSCFVCRQVISEFFPQDAKIVCYANNGDKLELTVKDLCPYPFNAEDLK